MTKKIDLLNYADYEATLITIRCNLCNKDFTQTKRMIPLMVCRSCNKSRDPANKVYDYRDIEQLNKNLLQDEKQR